MENQKTILIVDDEETLRNALKIRFTKEGYNILEAENGEIAIKVAKENKPDLIFLDILMPIKGGLDVARILREDEWGKNAKIVLLTNTKESEHVSEALKYGLYDYLIKGETKIDDIVLKVKEIL